MAAEFQTPELKEFPEIKDQFPYRKETILGLLAEENISLEGTDAFVGRGGGLVGLEGGTLFDGIDGDHSVAQVPMSGTVQHPRACEIVR